MAAWTDRAWLDEAHAWIGVHLERLGLEQDGPVEQPHVRPWATVLRIPTTTGAVWFKAMIPLLAHEAGVVALLSRRRPDLVPGLYAHDAERGWMLMADGGERLREVIGREAALGRWLDVLPRYAELQLAVAGDADELVALGAPDRRLAVLPDRFEELGRYGEEVARVREWCAQLASYDIPETIQHDDLHDGQVFVHDGRYLFFDWGDACVSHPFSTLAVTLEGVLSWGLDDVEDSVDTTPFRAAYLESFAAHGSSDALIAAVEIATRLGWVSRALCAHELAVALGTQDEPDQQDQILIRLRLAFERSL